MMSFIMTFVAESSYESHNVYMWLKTYKSIGKLFDYGIMGQPLKSLSCGKLALNRLLRPPFIRFDIPFTEYFGGYFIKIIQYPYL
ncbi:hypothetical protein C4E22_00485 [ANME-1 cluster archaeon AG-394-G06]|nr:hypothetical protein [ANME-1 cluster archaeon AG-394-G06]